MSGRVTRGLDGTQCGAAHLGLATGGAQTAELGAALDRGVRSNPAPGRCALARTTAGPRTALAAAGATSAALAIGLDLVAARAASAADAGYLGPAGRRRGEAPIGNCGRRVQGRTTHVRIE